jgi:hypothetical protein
VGGGTARSQRDRRRQRVDDEAGAPPFTARDPLLSSSVVPPTSARSPPWPTAPKTCKSQEQGGVNVRFASLRALHCRLTRAQCGAPPLAREAGTRWDRPSPEGGVRSFTLRHVRKDETRALLLTIRVVLLRWLKRERAVGRASWRTGALGTGLEPGDHAGNRVRFVSNSVRNADEHWASSLSRNAPRCANA